MRIGIDASNLRQGGGITHLSELLRAASPNDYGIKQIIVWGGKRTIEHLPKRSWLEIVHVPQLDQSLPWRLFWQQVSLPKLAKQKCDLLFVPGGSSGGGFKPYVTMSRTMLPFEERELNRHGITPTTLRLRLLRYSQTKSFQQANGMIFLTEYARDVVMMRAKALSGCSTIIPHGVDDRFRSMPQPQHKISNYSIDKPFKLLYVSIIDVYKHQWHVAEAVAQLRQQGVPVTIDFVGVARHKPFQQLQQMISRVDAEGKFINCQGGVSFSHLHTLYHQADVFVFASSCENMPNILLEAMAAGLPIASSNKGPMPEILEDAGVYFDPEIPQEIADALLTLINSPGLREECAWKGYKRAEQYSWEKCAKQTFTFLVQVARENGILIAIPNEARDTALTIS